MLRSLVEDQDAVSYIIIGEECGAAGTPHLQGYLELKSRSGMRRIKDLIGRRAHVEIARGDLQSNQDYCKKEGLWQEFGTPSRGQGARSDLLSVKAAIDAGATDVAIADDFFGQWVRYSKMFKEYRALKTDIPRNFVTRTVILYGPTGTGKTRFCHDQVMDRSYWSPGDYEWFDGYEGQEIVIIDDYRGEYPLPFFLKLLDRYPMRVKVKGSFTNWCPRKIFITSNVDPRDWYLGADERSRSAFMRRVSRIHHVDVPIYDDILLGDEEKADLSSFIQ